MNRQDKNNWIPWDLIFDQLQENSNEKETTQLNSWLKQDRKHQVLWDEIRLIWVNIRKEAGMFMPDKEKAWRMIEAKLSNSSTWQKYEYHPYRNVYRLLKPALKIAAVFVAAFLVSIVTIRLLDRPAEITENISFIEMDAPNGSRAFLTLDDGTKVWLNAGSNFRYPKNYGEKNRNVTLSGEAYFEVAHNKLMPFIVNANGINVTALGTAFNVRAYKEEEYVETTLTEGMVRVEPVNPKKGVKPVVLKPNQKVSLKTDGQAISGIVRLTDTGPYTSWKDGRWVFKQQNLYELSAKLARRYDVTFVFESEQLKDYIISGTLLDETLEQVLKTLQFIAPIDYIINHKTVTLKENQQLRKKYHDQNLINK